jgi:inosine/xanthosine triphosphatase
MQRIAVGSTNRVKIAAVEEVVYRVWPLADVISIDVPSGVNSQPLSDDETIRGVLYRAKAALHATSADLSLGLEGGVQEMSYGLFLCNWAVAIDRGGRVGYGASTRLQLPESIASLIRTGHELGPIMDTYTGRQVVRHTNGAIGVLTDDLVTRQLSFEHAVSYALAPFLHPERY